MQIIDLFSGIGGFSYAGHSLGWNTVQMVESNPFCQRVLKYHFPEAAIHSDIKTFNIDELRKSKWNPDKPSIITGGFPCQPYSAAGKRQGKEDERHLWPEMLRGIREVHPRWVVGENVLGIISWNGGMVFDEVQADLEAEGYEVRAYVLPACGVDAPHQRFRVWFVAHSNDARAGQCLRTDGDWSDKNDRREGQPQPEFGQSGSDGIASNSESGRSGGLRDEVETSRPCESGDVLGGSCGVQCERGISPNAASDGGREDNRAGEPRLLNQTCESINWHNFPTQPPLRGGDDGLPSELAGLTFSNWRNNAIKALGNSIVPQVALQIFKSIEEYEHNIHLYS